VLFRSYFQYDNVKHQMLGERSGKRYRLGDRLRVDLVRADLESGRIDFVLSRRQELTIPPVSPPLSTTDTPEPLAPSPGNPKRRIKKKVAAEASNDPPAQTRRRKPKA
jgi:ribonuclease R